MIVPLTNNPGDVNVALIRIAAMNNSDIDAMKSEVNSMKNQQSELDARYKSQTKRWKNYKYAYNAVLNQYAILNGDMSRDEIAALLPG